MADEETERTSTSEATPPHAEDSPEMEEQPSTPEDERVSSSSDLPPPEPAVDSPPEAEVSTTEEGQGEDATPSHAATQLSVLLLGREAANPAGTSRHCYSGIARETGNEAEMVEVAPAWRAETVRHVIDEVMVREVFESEPMQEALERAHAIELVDAQIRSEQDLLIQAAPRNTEPEKVDDFDLLCDMDDYSPSELSQDPSSDNSDEDSSTSVCSKTGTSGESGVERESPRTISGVPGEQKEDSVSVASEDAKLESDSSPKPGAAIKGEGSTTKNDKISESSSSSTKVSTATQVSESTAPQNIRKLSDAPPLKTSTATQVSETSAPKNIRAEDHLSPPKIGTGKPGCETGATKNVGVGSEFISPERRTAAAEASGSVSDAVEKKLEELSSPKRKLDSNYQHLQPKRSSPFTSPLKTSDQQVSTLLGDLDIKETKTPKSSKSASRQEKVMGREMREAGESQQEEAAQERRLAMKGADENKAKEVAQVKSMDTRESEEPRWEGSTKESRMETVEDETIQSKVEIKIQSKKGEKLDSSIEMKDVEFEQGSSIEMKDVEFEQGSSIEMKDVESVQGSSIEMKDVESGQGSSTEMKDVESESGSGTEMNVESEPGSGTEMNVESEPGSSTAEQEPQNE